MQSYLCAAADANRNVREINFTALIESVTQECRGNSVFDQTFPDASIRITDDHVVSIQKKEVFGHSSFRRETIKYTFYWPSDTEYNVFYISKQNPSTLSQHVQVQSFNLHTTVSYLLTNLGLGLPETMNEWCNFQTFLHMARANGISLQENGSIITSENKIIELHKNVVSITFSTVRGRRKTFFYFPSEYHDEYHRSESLPNNLKIPKNLLTGNMEWVFSDFRQKISN